MPHKNPKEKKEERRKYNKAYYFAHREELRKRAKTYRLAHKDEKQKYDKDYRAVHKEEGKVYYNTHREEIWEKREQLKFEVFQHYSGGLPRCIACGETDIIVLTIDHINNDGAEHRKTQGTGTGLYRWLRKNGYPEGYQVLCANCNTRKEFEHRRAKALQS